MKILKLNNLFKKFIGTLLTIFLATTIGYVFRSFGFPETNVVIIYILAIQILAWLSDDIPTGIIASILSTLTFNYFFTEPYFTLSVHDSSYIITFFVMTVSSVITSTLTSIANKNALIASDKALETKLLYQLTNHLTDADEVNKISSIVVKTLSEYLSIRVGLLCFDEYGNPELSYIQQISEDDYIRRETENASQIKCSIEQLRTSFDENDEFFDWPIYGRENILGIIRIPKIKDHRNIHKNSSFIHSVIESTAIAMDRIRVAEQRIKDRDETIQERYRSTLLRSISHDLRTPLSSIMGTSEMLLGMEEINENEESHLLVETIYSDAKWLYNLVENILSLTRLQEGKLVIGKQPELVEELLSSVLERFSVKVYGKDIEVIVPEDPLIISMDAKLIEQVLLNLLDNAYKHSKEDGKISVIVTNRKEDNVVAFSIIDSGTGIFEEDLPHIFELFYTSNSKKSIKKNSLGLGLPICDAIIKAHNGTFEIRNRVDSSGVEAIFTLPVEAVNNE